jgi:urease accessory protein
MSVQFTRLSAAGAALMALAGPAAAHTGSAPVVGFVSGFLHPFNGLDHILAMVAVGMLAALIGGRALWLVPASFLGAMVVGSALGFSLPFVELGIVASVIVLGAAVALAPRMPVALAMALAAAFAVFHGHAHGAEMPAAASVVSYGLGFVFATALLHAGGVGLGLVAERLSEGAGRAALRVGGGAVAALGLALLVV